MSGSTSTLLFASLFPILFVGMWLVTTLVISRFSGWSKLEESLPDRSSMAVQTFRFQGFYLGKGKIGTSYRGCVTFDVCKDGLRVRIWKLFAPFSGPIFIPWDKMEVEKTKIFTFSATRLKIGRGGEYWMTLAGSTARKLAGASDRFTVP